MAGEVWFTSDTHYGHKLMAELRGFPSIEEHDGAVLDAYLSTVKRGDVVFHLGDFMLPYKQDQASSLLRQMPGTKMLIIGNHDTGKLTKHKEWAWTGHIRGRKIAKVPFVLCHYALRSWPGMGRGAIHLYGHSHGNLAPDYGRSMDVGVDTRSDYRPWNLEEVVEVMGKISPLIVDHHDAHEGETEEVGGEI